MKRVNIDSKSRHEQNQISKKKKEVEGSETISSETDHSIEVLTPADNCKTDIAKKIQRGPLLAPSENSDTDGDIVSTLKKSKSKTQVSRPHRKKNLLKDYGESEADSFLDDDIGPEWVNIETIDSEEKSSEITGDKIDDSLEAGR